MSAVLTSPMPGSRPKIHRLPAAHVRQVPASVPKNSSLQAFINYSPYVAGAALVLALLAAIPAQPEEQPIVHEAGVLPQISVTPQDEAALDALTIKGVHTTMAMNNAVVLPPVAVVQPVMSQPVAPVLAQITDDSRGKTIILQGQNEAIIGQMARIPLENEQITEIKSASEVDNSAGRELLSIINKY